MIRKNDLEAFYVLGLFGVLGGFLWLVRRDNEIFRVEIERGKARVVRGKVPPSFLGDLRTITRHVERGTIRAVKQDGQARILGSASIDEGTLQRLRNALATQPGRGGSRL